ncbi:excisionase family DNA-binding protein [Agathobacter sp.]|jgi:DNA binding domain, excisionase family|uniref:excisionase family DNA-binding protein n=1 Tax=Agathobacter sp. TaxID=2021311 RepID=UPI00280AB25A|nr:excisionase family DNA-binding protein [Agathobacter sp.]
MNKPLLLRGLVAAMSDSREMTIEETDATKSTKGATSSGKTTMSVQELSAQMGISLPKAYELVKTPGFPTIRIGARILIPIEAYKEWLVRTSINH